MTRARRWIVALVVVLVALPAAAKDRTAVTVVAAGGTPLAREVAAALEAQGLYVDLAPPGGAAVTLPVEPARSCLSEGRSLSFRLEYGAAIAALESCLERLGPALARPEGAGALSALLVELGAAAVGAGERERARAAFARLARLPDATPPDASVHPPAVIQAWEEARRSGEPTRPVLVETLPPWATVWIDGRAVSTGERVPLAQGPHFATADAPGFQTWSGVLLVEGDTTRLPVRLTPLDPEARAAAVRARAGSMPPAAPGAADEITAAFGTPVVMVAGGRGGAPSALLLLPGGAGARGSIGGRWTPASGDAAQVIATGVARKLGAGGGRGKKRTLYLAGAAAAGVLAAGAAAFLLVPREPEPGDKTGSVVWEPPPPPLPPDGRP